ncbi:uncharacterized protein LOC119737556 [Patiria miniata]|uniref:Ig-like domain-containing protein n=1 Tax=Patiria miniata TaxID=46514 RepID=A0A914AVZ6_PATMI|nr:uncharacterized protein LOC119737556 [Patiria miniata]
MLSLSNPSHLVGLLLAILVTEAAAITIIRGPQDQTVNLGGTVVFRCTVSNKGNFKVYWFFDRANRYLSADTTFFADAMDARLSIVGNLALGQFNLRIAGVRASDAGVYRCGYVPAGTNMLTSRAARLTVRLPPDEGFPRCEVSPPAGMIRLGQRATLTCTSQGGVPPASLTWLRNGMEITPAVQRRNVIERTFDEALNGVRFTCRATSPAIMGDRICSLVPLSINPTARVEPPQLIARPGDTVVFECVTGGPSPIVEISWTFGGIFVPPLQEPNRFELSMDRLNLTIRDVQLADDETSVQCTVAIAQGLSATAGALLRVVPPPTDLTTLIPTTVTPFTTLTPDVNQTQPLPTPQYRDGLGTGSIIGIIIGGIAATQLIIIVIVFISHRLSSDSKRPYGTISARGDSMVPSLAGWTGQQVSHTPYEGLDASGRSASVIRYLTLHPLRVPPTRYSTTDVGVYEEAGDLNTNTILYESGYVPPLTYTGNIRDSMDIDQDVYQPALRSSAANPDVYEQPRASVNLTCPTTTDGDYYEPPEVTQQLTSANQSIRSQVSQDGDYYEPPEVTEQLASSHNRDPYYYEPQPDTDKTRPLADDESEVYEVPPSQVATAITGGNNQQTNNADDNEYYEPPVEETQQSSTPVMTHATDAHVYDVAPDGDEYEIPDGSDANRR